MRPGRSPDKAPAALDEEKVLAALPPDQREAVSSARELARKQGVGLYLVGGAVRDLLLRRPLGDTDLTIEGDAPRFAGSLVRRLGGRARSHRRFRTATIVLPSGGRLDLATAREEVYERPGALPRVRPAGIREDLARRDFTVNAMALRIAPDYDRAVLDPFRGRRDLAARTIRFLHPRSPTDDPTRAFRAVRYANRLGFKVAPGARAAIRRALATGSFAAVSGDRLRRELERLLLEEDRAAAVAQMEALGLTAVLHPALPGSKRFLTRMKRLERRLSRLDAGWFSYLLAWAAELDETQAEELASRLNLDRDAARRLRQWPSNLALLRGISRKTRSEAASIVRLLNPTELAVAAEWLEDADRRTLGTLISRPVSLRIRGRDLLEAGASPGPGIGKALASTFAARVEGVISEHDELDFALAAWRGER